MITIDFGDFEITVPTKKTVCPTCQGIGTHIHPAFHNQAVEQELLQDEEFMGSYMTGGMEVTCTHCNGNNVIDSPIIPKEHKAAYNEMLQEIADSEYERECERRMGA